MDVVSGDFRFDFASGKVASQVNGHKQYLDPEISGEGVKVIMSDGETVTYNPPPAKPSMPDWSEIKNLKKYFNRTDYHFFPIWLYHPTEEPQIAKNAEDAWTRFGVRLLERTADEQAQYGGGKYRWAWSDTTQWRPAPIDKKAKFDAQNPGHGKNLIVRPPDPSVAQNALLAELIPLVTAAVAGALTKGGSAAAPAEASPVIRSGLQPVTADSALWQEFLAFQAFKDAQSVESGDVKTAWKMPPLNFAASVETETVKVGGKPEWIEDEKAAWLAKAKEAGIKVDGRWSLDKLRDHVMAELERRVAAVEAGTAHEDLYPDTKEPDKLD